MSEMSEEMEALLWKITTLLRARAAHKKHPEEFTARTLAKLCNVSERQAYRYLAEANEIFLRLLPCMMFQPDWNGRLAVKQYLRQLKEMGLLEKWLKTNEEELKRHGLWEDFLKVSRENLKV